MKKLTFLSFGLIAILLLSGKQKSEVDLFTICPGNSSGVTFDSGTYRGALLNEVNIKAQKFTLLFANAKKVNESSFS